MLTSIREHLSSPDWKRDVQETLDGMITGEFGEGAKTRVKELNRSLDEVNRLIAKHRFQTPS